MKLCLKVQNIQNKGELEVQVNNKPIAFTYSTSAKTISFVVSNVTGSNKVKVKATNRCGTDIENFTINYTPCQAPTVSITSPSAPMVVKNIDFIS